eukprot:1021547-Ditylum_brightwellii.AAC.1
MVHYNYCRQREVKDQVIFSHRKCVHDRKCESVKGGLMNRNLGKEAFLDEVEYRVCQWMAQKLKDLKIPCKRSSSCRKKMAAPM